MRFVPEAATCSLQVREAEGRTGGRSPREGAGGGRGAWARGGQWAAPRRRGPSPRASWPRARFAPGSQATVLCPPGSLAVPAPGEGLCHLGRPGRNSPGRSTQAGCPPLALAGYRARRPTQETPLPAALAPGGRPPPPGLNSDPGHRWVGLGGGAAGSLARSPTSPSPRLPTGAALREGAAGVLADPPAPRPAASPSRLF